MHTHMHAYIHIITPPPSLSQFKKMILLFAMNELERFYAKRNKPDTEKYFIWSLKNIKKQNPAKHIDIDKTLTQTCTP